MNQVKETLTGLLIGIGVYSVIVEIIGIIFSEDILSYTLGLLAGVVVAVILIIHMTTRSTTVSSRPRTRRPQGHWMMPWIYHRMMQPDI